jgi:hypothetical protein
MKRRIDVLHFTSLEDARAAADQLRERGFSVEITQLGEEVYIVSARDAPEDEHGSIVEKSDNPPESGNTRGPNEHGAEEHEEGSLFRDAGDEDPFEGLDDSGYDAGDDEPF